MRYIGNRVFLTAFEFSRALLVSYSNVKRLLNMLTVAGFQQVRKVSGAFLIEREFASGLVKRHLEKYRQSPSSSFIGRAGDVVRELKKERKEQQARSSQSIQPATPTQLGLPGFEKPDIVYSIGTLNFVLRADAGSSFLWYMIDGHTPHVCHENNMILGVLLKEHYPAVCKALLDRLDSVSRNK